MENKRIKVIYDYPIFVTQRYGGISRYFYELIKRIKGMDTKVLLLFSDNSYLQDKDITNYVNITHSVFKIFKGTFRQINYINVKYRLGRGKFIFHPTYYNTYFLSQLHGNPFVLTVHDMIHEIYPQYFAPNDPTSSNKRLLVEKATRIIAISEQTKKDLISIFGTDPNKIDVIYHGINQVQIKYRGLKLPMRYILYVGGRNGYKNFAKFIEAFAYLHQGDADLRLICTGKDFNSKEKNMLKEFNVLNVSSTIQADDKELAQLYQQAQLFIYPSLYEGFGIPILEAWINSCPVVLSEASCFPEIAGDSAEYFNPQEVESMVTAMENVLYNQNRQEELVNLGSERVKLYTWDETARLTEITYQKALNSI